MRPLALCRAIAGGLCGLLFILASPANAQAAASSYRVGEHVEVKPTPWQDRWEEGVVTEISQYSDQVIVRSPSTERAFNMSDVRHLGQQGETRSPPVASPNMTADRINPGQAGAGPPPAGSAAAIRGARTGERVSVTVSGSCCYPGTITGTGSGAMAGYYLIHFDSANYPDQYARASNVAPLGAGRAATQTPPRAARGRQGRYNCVIGMIGGKPVCLTTAPPG